jgi:hypothetical protein
MKKRNIKSKIIYKIKRMKKYTKQLWLEEKIFVTK